MTASSNKPNAGGIPGGMKGAEYQQNLISLYSLNAFNRSLPFECWTEDTNAGKFDDLIIKYVDGTKIKYTFLQAKHKVHPKEVSFLTLFSDKNFMIHKYFESFVDIEEYFGINYNDVDLTEVALATNNNLPKPKKGKIILKNPSIKNRILRLRAVQDHEIFNSLGSVFVFENEPDNRKCLQEALLAIELAKLLFEKSLPEPSKLHLLRHSKDFLVSEVFHLNENSIEFRQEFLQSGSSETESFRKRFQQAFESKFFDVDPKYKKTEDFWAFLKELKLDQNLISKIASFDSDENFVSQKVEYFMKKFTLITSLENLKVENAINFEILTQINDFNELKKTSLEFHEFIKNWLLDKQNSPWSEINNKNMSEIFQSILISSQNKWKSQNFKFSNNDQDLTNFIQNPNLNSMENQILIYEVAKNETHWGAARLYNIKNSIFYLNSQFDDKTFDIALKTVKESTESQEICLVLECSGDLNSFLTKFWDSFVSQLKVKQNARLIVICEEGLNYKNFEGLKKIVQNEILCGEISENSLNVYFEKPIDFQGSSVNLKELINVSKLQAVPLKELESLSEMGTQPVKPSIYIPRKMYRKTHLKEQLLEDSKSKKFKDHLFFNDAEYKQFLTNNTSKPENVHLIERFDENSSTNNFVLKWLISNQSLDTLRPYIKQHERNFIEDTNFLSNLSPITLISGQAGMGKSSFLQNLAYELKLKFPHYWVQKIDLQAYLKDLKDLEKSFDKKSMRRDDFEGIRKFFNERFVNLKSPLLSSIFNELMESGKVILLLDGYDEICESYKEDTVISIVDALTDESKGNKIFLSTRPEWAEMLENRFLRFTFWFEPFSENNQIEFLKNFWGKDETWTDFIKAVLDNINNSLTKKQKSYTGIPLITKLVGDFFEGKIEDENLKNNPEQAKEFTTKKYSLVDLIAHSVNKHFEICCTKQLGLNENNPSFRTTLKSLKTDHQKLALKIVFPKYFKKLWTSHDDFDEETNLRFIKTGLVFQVNDVFKFYHQTCAEFLIALYLKQNFNNKTILEFIFKVVLFQNGCQIIRLFLNDFIGNLVSNQNQNLVKHLISKHIQVLNVAAKESNEETFNVLLDTLMQDSNDGRCTPILNIVESFQIKRLLKTKDEDNLSIFYNFLANCDASPEIFDKIKMKFGLRFVKQILTVKNGKQKWKTMCGAAFLGNYTQLANWITKEFSGNPNIIEAILFTKDQIEEDILHKKVDDFEFEYFIALLNELKCLDSYAEEKFLNQLILHKNKSGETFIQSLVIKLPKRKIKLEEIFQTTIKILEWIQQNTNSVDELLASEDVAGETLVFYAAKYFKNQLLDLLKIIQNWVKLNEILVHKNSFGKNFSFYLILDSNDGDENPITTDILNFIIETNVNLLKEIYDTTIFSEFLFDSIRFDVEKKEIFTIIITTLVDWFKLDFPKFNSFELLLRIFENRYNFLQTNVGENYVKNDFTTRVLNELNWLKKISVDFFPELICHKNSSGETFIQSLIKELSEQKTKSEVIFQLTFKILEWILQNTNAIDEIFTVEDNHRETLIFYAAKYFKNQFLDFLNLIRDSVLLRKILIQKNKSEESFLIYFISDVKNDDEISIFMNVLEFIKKTDVNIVKEICDSNIRNKHILQSIAENDKKKEIYIIYFTTLINWFELNCPNFEDFKYLSKIFEIQKKYLELHIRKNSHENDPTMKVLNILNWFKKVSLNFFRTILLENKRFLFDLCREFKKKSYLPNFITNFFTCTEFTCMEFTKHFLISVYSCSTFSKSFIKNDEHNEAALAITNTLQWLKETDSVSFYELINAKDCNSYNLLQLLCFDSRIYDYKFLPNIFQTLVIWLQNNLPNFDLEHFVNYRTYADSFVYFCSENCYEEILNWLRKFNYDLYKKVIMDSKRKIYVENWWHEELKIRC